MANANKKHRFTAGFTLVEMIVVLVILVILASIGIPSLTGYLRSVQEKAAIAECTQCVGAAETLSADSLLSGIYLEANDASLSRIKSMAGIKDGGEIPELTFGADREHSVLILSYKAPSGIRVLYQDGVYTVTDEAANTLGNLQRDFEAFKDEWNTAHTGVSFGRAELMEAFYSEFPQYATYQPVDAAVTTDLFGPTFTTELTWVAYPLMKNGQITDIIYYATPNPPANVDEFIASPDNSTCRKGTFVLINGTIYYLKGTDSVGYGDPRNNSFTDAAGIIKYVTDRKFKTMAYTP